MRTFSKFFLAIIILLTINTSLWARTPCHELHHLIDDLEEISDDVSDFDSPIEWAIMDDQIAEIVIFLNIISNEADDFHLEMAVDDLTDAYRHEDEDDFEDALHDVIFSLIMIYDDEC